MSKPKENAYKEDQDLWDLNKVDLESLDESKLKAVKDHASMLYSKARKDRIETQRVFLRAYRNTKNKLKELYDSVNDGKTTPENAVSDLQNFVADKTELSKSYAKTKEE